MVLWTHQTNSAMLSFLMGGIEMKNQKDDTLNTDTLDVKESKVLPLEYRYFTDALAPAVYAERVMLELDGPLLKIIGMNSMTSVESDDVVYYRNNDGGMTPRKAMFYRPQFAGVTQLTEAIGMLASLLVTLGSLPEGAKTFASYFQAQKEIMEKNPKVLEAAGRTMEYMCELFGYEITKKSDGRD